VLRWPGLVKIFVCTLSTDMRRSFDGLAALASEVVREDPLSGHLFVFINRRRDRVKVLWWDEDGYALFYKRLETGTFEMPRSIEGRMEMSHGELGMLLDGVDLSSVRRRRRFRLTGT
jgi:transposase